MRSHCAPYVTVTAGGVVTFGVRKAPTKNAMFTACASVDQIISAVGEVVAFGEEALDVDNDFASNMFTAPVAGYYGRALHNCKRR
jgi:hypothetical protein